MIPRLAAVCLLAASCLALAAIGLVESPARPDAGPVTVFCMASGMPKSEGRGDFVVDVAIDAAPQHGNGRLVVTSRGSPSSPWPYFALARTLVELGLFVPVPEHHADNQIDDSESGPSSWKRRPFEVSWAIGRVTEGGRFKPLLQVDRASGAGVRMIRGGNAGSESRHFSAAMCSGRPVVSCAWPADPRATTLRKSPEREARRSACRQTCRRTQPSRHASGLFRCAALLARRRVDIGVPALGVVDHVDGRSTGVV